MVNFAVLEALIQTATPEVESIIDDNIDHLVNSIDKNTGLSITSNGIQYAIPVSSDGIHLEVFGTANAGFKITTSYDILFKIEETHEMQCVIPWSSNFVAYELIIEMPDASKITAEIMSAKDADEAYKKAKQEGKSAFIADADAGNVLCYTFNVSNLIGNIKVSICGTTSKPTCAGQNILIPMRPYNPGTFYLSPPDESEYSILEKRRKMSDIDVPLFITLHEAIFQPKLIDTSICVIGINQYKTTASKNSIEIGYNNKLKEPTYLFTQDAGLVFYPLPFTHNQQVPVVICDFSGSMQGQNLHLQNTAVSQVCKRFEKMRLILFHNHVFFDKMVDKNDIENLLKTHSQNLGGTNINNVFEHISTHKIEKAIIFTDDAIYGNITCPNAEINIVGVGGCITDINIEEITSKTGGSYKMLKTNNEKDHIVDWCTHIFARMYEMPVSISLVSENGTELDIPQSIKFTKMNQGGPSIICYTNGQPNVSLQMSSSEKLIQFIGTKLDPSCNLVMAKAKAINMVYSISNIQEQTEYAIQNGLLIKGLTKFFTKLESKQPTIDNGNDGMKYRSLSQLEHIDNYSDNDSLFRSLNAQPKSWAPSKQTEDDESVIITKKLLDYLNKNILNKDISVCNSISTSNKLKTFIILKHILTQNKNHKMAREITESLNRYANILCGISNLTSNTDIGRFAKLITV